MPCGTLNKKDRLSLSIGHNGGSETDFVQHLHFDLCHQNHCRCFQKHHNLPSILPGNLQISVCPSPADRFALANFHPGSTTPLSPKKWRYGVSLCYADSVCNGVCLCMVSACVLVLACVMVLALCYDALNCQYFFISVLFHFLFTSPSYSPAFKSLLSRNNWGEIKQLLITYFLY